MNLLKPYYEDIGAQKRSESRHAPIAAVTIFNKDVECILADRVIRRMSVPAYNEYLVMWRDLPDSEASW